QAGQGLGVSDLHRVATEDLSLRGVDGEHVSSVNEDGQVRLRGRLRVARNAEQRAVTRDVHHVRAVVQLQGRGVELLQGDREALATSAPRGPQVRVLQGAQNALVTALRRSGEDVLQRGVSDVVPVGFGRQVGQVGGDGGTNRS